MMTQGRTGGDTKPVVCFGEMLLRLSPQRQIPLAQAGSVAIDVGGAEANVAAALASLGLPTRMLSVVPDNPLGRKAIAAIGASGSDARFIATAPGRIGLYFFEPPAGPIAGRVTYDRAGSSFALADPATLPFAQALDGASLLHMSGITPALGPDGVALARAAVGGLFDPGRDAGDGHAVRGGRARAVDAEQRPVFARLFVERGEDGADFGDEDLHRGADDFEGCHGGSP